MPRLLQVLILGAVVGLLSASDGAAQAPLKVEGIVIETNSAFIEDKAFVTKITAALQLLKAKAPEELKLMRSVIGKIRATQVSGANFYEEVMTIDIARGTFDASLEWLASVLIHETTHINKFKTTGKRYGDAHLITDKKKALRVMIDEELDCNRIQAVVLQKVGGQQYELEYLKGLKGGYFDVDKDGDYDEDDYKNRSW